MEPKPDVEKIKEIYRAEREADRIVREGEDAARALVAEAAEAARNLLAARWAGFARRSGEALGRVSAENEREAQAFLENARLRTESWTRRSEEEIDSIADALLDGVLPP